ncbi:MAG: hypothetical protein DKT66_24405 [Candidatus Melainabacteria bacterium]|nr:MAG: hypothetical protein DKT66_24405 [Candidatus Melainabacteria bacterium]
MNFKTINEQLFSFYSQPPAAILICISRMSSELSACIQVLLKPLKNDAKQIAKESTNAADLIHKSALSVLFTALF